ncbi:protein singed [Escherichia coli]
MITYVTCDDVDNAFGNAWTSENAKNKAVLMANAWLNGFNLKINPSRIPEEVKLAGAYAARIASFGKLFQQKNDSGVVISKAVEAAHEKRESVSNKIRKLKTFALQLRQLFYVCQFRLHLYVLKIFTSSRI